MTQKFCNKCQQWKKFDQFHKSSAKPDGHTSNCKACRQLVAIQYSQSGNRKASLDRYNATEKAKAIRKHYEKTEKGKAATRRYLQTEAGRQSSRLSSARTRQKYPDKLKAQYAVGDAVKMGKILPANRLSCIRCGKQAKDYHHWSYDKEHWLDVIPLCRPCHAEADKERRQS